MHFAAYKDLYLLYLALVLLYRKNRYKALGTSLLYLYVRVRKVYILLWSLQNEI